MAITLDNGSLGPIETTDPWTVGSLNFRVDAPHETRNQCVIISRLLT